MSPTPTLSMIEIKLWAFLIDQTQDSFLENDMEFAARMRAIRAAFPIACAAFEAGRRHACDALREREEEHNAD